MPSGTRDNSEKSGTVPEFPGQLEPMDCVAQPMEVRDMSLQYLFYSSTQLSSVYYYCYETTQLTMYCTWHYS